MTDTTDQAGRDAADLRVRLGALRQRVEEIVDEWERYRDQPLMDRRDAIEDIRAVLAKEAPDAES